MGHMKRAIDYVGRPAAMLLELVDIAEARGNDRLRRMWQRQYLRLTDERGAHV
ncbi:hypothetical protein [Paenibacillus sp. YIM B09110]|uniref:hypothetical protein n=1 Tax=Paenibacillus sp. YIM B09110 TaxID=3126102 RepID=UPI00301C416E